MKSLHTSIRSTFLFSFRLRIGAYYHAHHFLSGEGFTGNWATFAKRNMKRLQKSSGFYGGCVHDDKRKIVVMKFEKKEYPTLPQPGDLKTMMKEFPPLPGVGKFILHCYNIKNITNNSTDPKLKPKPKKYRVSYAVVAGRKKPPTKPTSNHPAYKAWENRHGKGKPFLTAAEKKAKKKASEKALKDFAAWVSRGQEKNCPLRNRFQVLASPVM